MKIKPNSGGIIKGIAETIKWIGYIGFSLLFVLIFFLAPLFLRWDFGVAFFVGLLVLGVGCLISWLSTRLLQGFGELVQYTAEAASYLEHIAAQRPEMAAETDPKPAAPSPSRPSSKSFWRCAKCGYENDASASVCEYCGKPRS